jgi:hypothetical protein
MASRDVLEEWLEHGQFEPGGKNPTPDRWQRVRVSGLFLIIAAGVGYFSLAYRVVQGRSRLA